MSRRFNGSSDKMRTANQASTVLDNYTMFARIFPTSYPAAGNSACIMQNGHGGGFGNGYGWFIDENGIVNLDVAFVASLTSNFKAPLSRWSSIALIRRNTVWRFYFNGKPDTATITNTSFNPAGGYHFGVSEDESGTAADFFAGCIQDGAHWDRALTDRELWLLGQGFAKPTDFRKNLVMHVPMTYDSAPGIDIASTANNMTVTGTVAGVSYPYKRKVLSIGNSIVTGITVAEMMAAINLPTGRPTFDTIGVVPY